MAGIRLESVTKRFGNTVALDRVSLNISDGEIFTLLGPSGCGKTTTLRVIAGFETPDEGRVYIGSRDVTMLKPYERNTAMVFQNYALWPHMRVFDNIAYGLKLRKLPRSEIVRRVRWAAELLEIDHLLDRYPHQLSGGQQQRVAVARAIVTEPEVLLMDEPLSNLDAHLRLKMREEIVRLQKRLGVTIVYVTHDQEEALSISHRVAVMNRGRVEQVGTPMEVYEKPATYFVATFIGRSTVLDGRVSEVLGSGMVRVALEGGLSIVGTDMEGGLRQGERVKVVIRPERVKVGHEYNGENVFEGKVSLAMFLGWRTQLKVEVGGQEITIYSDPRRAPLPGQPVRFYIDPEEAKVYRQAGSA
ncbi:ABC transporter, ATP binding protein [Aeropyrum pernix K1]|uniref:ABC transporter, ATP binding protein n=1 Tax=Aeropyrum pernix (strain ATCC 700893 / DSM 11879 / JCM 9820 / NBRC 100138 / K1) TaxID=272557 RepID=Q9YB65_AERPE|nr:ABC transporter ATP-binding protein [Aeropyrum pernix]BAA80733.1 ABC transporter, ATP binding protein [Aeropyrum pernix K1]